MTIEQAGGSIQAPGAHSGRWIGRLGPAHALMLLAVVTAVLAFDALVRSRGDFDYRLINEIRGTDFPGAGGIADILYRVGDPVVLLVAWLVGLGVFGLLRRWLEMAVWASFALAGLAAWALALAVGRPRPQPHEVGWALPVIGEIGESAFPSATIIGTILLLGFLSTLAGRIERRWRWPIWAALGFLALALGWASIRVGQNWVGDVVAGYVIGVMTLIALAMAYGSMAPVFGKLPLVRAADLPHDEAQPHAHALTSLILFGEGVTTKIYSPGFVPRFIYWLAFQAPFAYTYSETALAAAVLRRNLAGLFTEYWFGNNLVAPAIGVMQVDGRLAITSRYNAGTEPSDRRRARTFLAQLADRFDDAGLPTWQVDPRQPRSLGNILETETGEYVVIDLESGMVSPVASPRAWWRSIRRAQIPLFDDVFFDITRAYVAREEARMRETMGDVWIDRLRSQLEAAEEKQTAWHAMEPRFWSATLRFAWSGFGLGPLRRWLLRKRDRARDLALDWLTASIDRWEAEGRFTGDEARLARDRLSDPALQDVLPHFGIHLVIGIALRFPFGSIARATYTLGSLLIAFLALLFRRTDLRGFRRALSIHSPLVIVVAAMPAIGTFSYLLSRPMLANYRVWRVAADTVGMKFPFHVYERLGARRVIAGRTPQSHEPGESAA